MHENGHTTEPQPSGTGDGVPGLVLNSEQFVLTPTWRDAGTIRIRKEVEEGIVDTVLPRKSEVADAERVPVAEGDSGEIEYLEDGSVSVPLFEEEFVVTKRTVVRERMIIRKRVEERLARVHGELRRERVEIDADEGAMLETPGVVQEREVVERTLRVHKP